MYVITSFWARYFVLYNSIVKMSMPTISSAINLDCSGVVHGDEITIGVHTEFDVSTLDGSSDLSVLTTSGHVSWVYHPVGSRQRKLVWVGDKLKALEF